MSTWEGVTVCSVDMMYFTMQVLHRSLQDRISCYKGLQERIVARACIYFTHFLAQRDYDGKLRFNHEKERLEMQVCVCVCLYVCVCVCVCVCLCTFVHASYMCT